MRASPTAQVLAGLVLGLVLGIPLASVEAPWADTLIAWVEPVGALWVNAIRMTVIPLIVSLLLGGIASSGAGTAARVGGRAVAWIVGLVAFGSTLAGFTVPGLYHLLGGDGVRIPELVGVHDVTGVTVPPFRDWFVGLLPPNPIEAAAQSQILPLVLFTVIFGLAATRIPEDLRQTVVRGAKAVSEMALVVVRWIMAVGQVGVFALTLTLAARSGIAVLRAVATFLIVVLILWVVLMVIAYVLVRVVGGVPIRLFAKACFPAQAIAFSTRSSIASLPALLEEADRTLHLPEAARSLVLPAAVSTFKYYSQVLRIAGTYLVIILFGVQLGALEWAAIVGIVGLFGFYSPGIPSGGLFVIAPIYQAFGLPLEGIGILIALDLVPDMFTTAANVTGDMAVAVLAGGKREWQSAPEGFP